MGKPVRRAQHWIVRAGLAGLFLVLCVLAGFSVLTQREVARSAARADATSRLSGVYQDARYQVGLEQSLVRKFRLGPDVSVLVQRGQAETSFVADLQRIAVLAPASKAILARLTTAEGVLEDVGFREVQAVYAHDQRLSDSVDKRSGSAAFNVVQGIVSTEAAAAQDRAASGRTDLAKDSASATRATIVAFTLGLGLIAFFGMVIARISVRLNRARSAEFESMAQMAITDPLTGLRNHRAFHEDLARELHRAARATAPLSLVMLDLDDLKSVNDSLGHQAGDERLRALADAVRATQRGGDSAFRVGGDEFAVVLSGARAWGALEFAQRLAARLTTDARGATVTAGIAEAVEPRDKDELIREADLALIGAKRVNQHAAIYTRDMHPDADGAPSEDAHHTRTLANALALAVDAKDSYTRSHCQTVSQLCVVIAAELGFSAERLARIRLAGLLHDVGKIGVPDAILQKPAALTHDEYEQMKGHSVLGEAIIRAADMPTEASWVRHHHERIDGSGYPDGLSAQDTPLESRIIHVADAFEAMTSDRPYRVAPGQGYAVDELGRHSGTQFDAQVVGALLRQLDQSLAPAALQAAAVSA